MYNNPACKNANRHGIPFNLLPIANSIYFITCNFGKSAMPQYHMHVLTSPLGPMSNDCLSLLISVGGIQRYISKSFDKVSFQFFKKMALTLNLTLKCNGRKNA